MPKILTIKKNGHVITKNDINEVIQWDEMVNGFAGRIDYNHFSEDDGKVCGFSPEVTKDEIEIAKSWGVKVRNIPALKYSGTY